MPLLLRSQPLCGPDLARSKAHITPIRSQTLHGPISLLTSLAPLPPLPGHHSVLASRPTPQPPSCSSEGLGSYPPQGLCTGCALCWEAPPPTPHHIPMAPSSPPTNLSSNVTSSGRFQPSEPSPGTCDLHFVKCLSHYCPCQGEGSGLCPQPPVQALATVGAQSSPPRALMTLRLLDSPPPATASSPQGPGDGARGCGESDAGRGRVPLDSEAGAL